MAKRRTQKRPTEPKVPTEPHEIIATEGERATFDAAILLGAQDDQQPPAPTPVVGGRRTEPREPRNAVRTIAICQIVYGPEGELSRPEYPVVVEFSRVPCVGEHLDLLTQHNEELRVSVALVTHASYETYAGTSGRPLDAILDVVPV